MNAPRAHWLAYTGVTAVLFAACQSTNPVPSGPAGQAKITIAPLELEGIDNACYDLRVQNQAGDDVWQRGLLGQAPANKFPEDTNTICSSRYGNLGGGDIAYVGPCDASLVDDDGDEELDDPNTNTVTVWVDGLYRANGSDIGGWSDPCPNGCDLEVDCVENADVPVQVNLTMLREANQGFFDVAVNFEDIFCSAKLDCLDSLLHNGDTRDTTVVLGFACTAGEGETTTLYLNDIVIDCVGDPAGNPVIPPRTYTISPAAAQPGNQNPIPPGIFQWASYYGEEQLEPYDKCYWNSAIGIDLTALEPGCTLRVRGTAAGQAFTTPPFHSTPPNTVYPVITWDVPLTNLEGQMICDKHPLNGDNGVSTTYTTVNGEQFLNAYNCGENPTTSRLTCDASVAGHAVTIGQTGDEVTITANGHTIYYPPLSDELTIDSCCPDACCVAEVP